MAALAMAGCASTPQGLKDDPQAKRSFTVEGNYQAVLKRLVETHFKSTGSIRAREILSDWPSQRGRFVKVFPNEYRRALGEMAAATAKASASGQPA